MVVLQIYSNDVNSYYNGALILQRIHGKGNFYSFYIVDGDKVK